MKLKKKGKVYPCPPESDVLKLLPAAIMVVAALLSLEDREVLAYLISRSLNTTTITDLNKKPKKMVHKAPRFDCECFECYTSYWFRWDSSPSRELINQAIEAFEDHLATAERGKNARRHNVVPISEQPLPEDTAPTVSEVSSPARTEEEVVGEKVSLPVTKMMPDVLGSIKSRIWGLWNPDHV